MKRELCSQTDLLQRLRQWKNGPERVIFLEEGPGIAGEHLFHFLNVDARTRICLKVSGAGDLHAHFTQLAAQVYRNIGCTEVVLTDRLPVVFLGPFHPVLRGNISLQLAVEGEMIAAASFKQGYLQRNIEDKMTSLSQDSAMVFAELVNFDLPFAYSIAYAMAIEDLLKFSIPDRAKTQRMLFLELGYFRIRLVFQKINSDV